MSSGHRAHTHCEWMQCIQNECVQTKSFVDGGLALFSRLFCTLSGVFNLNLWACNEMIVVCCIVRQIYTIFIPIKVVWTVDNIANQHLENKRERKSKKVEWERGWWWNGWKSVRLWPQHNHVVMNMRTLTHWNCVPTVWHNAYCECMFQHVWKSNTIKLYADN